MCGVWVTEAALTVPYGPREGDKIQTFLTHNVNIKNVLK